MQTLNPYILLVQQQVYQCYQNSYYMYGLVGASVTLSFFIGRLLHQKKFSNLLHMVNNQENARRNLNQEINLYDSSLQKTKSKKYYAIISTIIVMLLLGIQIYLFPRYLFMSGTVAIIVLLGWICFVFRIKYIIWKKNRLQEKLKKNNISTDGEIKAILLELGDNINEGLKRKFQTQLKNQNDLQSRQQCRRHQCVHIKKVTNQLIDQYNKIIAQLKTSTWCDICSKQVNVNSTQLKSFIEKSIAKTNLNVEANLPIQRKKQLINALLAEWSKISSYLQIICKKGCCIKLRNQIEQIKKNYYLKIQALASRL